MARISLDIRYKKNTGILFSVEEIWRLFLYGIKIEGGEGDKFSDEAMRFYIVAAQKEIENWFNIKFVKQLIVDEGRSYFRDDYWTKFPILKTDYPVNEPLSLIGMFTKVEQIVYPQIWLTCHRASQGVHTRRVSVLPTGSATTEANADVILTGITSQIGFQRFDNIPDYWDLQYITGFDLNNLPYDLLNMVGKLASFGPLGIAGDLILGTAGIASQSLSIDGLSQSIGTTASATNAGYGARILQYERELKDAKDRLKLVYDEPKFEVL